MAEEEVDWGMDESADVDEWRQGAVEEAVVEGDEDVISLDGADEGEGERSRLFRLYSALRVGRRRSS